MVKTSLLYSLVGAIIALFYDTCAKELDVASLVSTRQLIRNAIFSDMRLLGGLVRLSFHDCVGNGCDGCINKYNQDNAGLKTYIDLIEPLYQSILTNGTDLSRSDFWAMAGTEAVYVGASMVRRPRGCRRCPPNPMPNIKFYAGRKDCTTSVPQGSPWTNDMHELPSAHWDAKRVLEYFQKTFGFDAKATTAIMGAHTIGTTHPGASGFHQPWVVRRNQLDNQFFKHMQDSNVGWHQTTTGTGRPVTGRRPPRGPRPIQYMWITGQDQFPQTMMMNSDMSLIKDLSNMTTIGHVTCEYEKCPETKEETLKWANAYAADNALFMSEFSKAFQAMTMNGYTNLKEIPSS